MKLKPSEANTLLNALTEVLDDVEGRHTLPSRIVDIEALDVCQIRQKYHLTQADFSKLFGFSLRTLQQWEQGRRTPQGSARILLKVIDYAPEIVHKALHL